MSISEFLSKRLPEGVELMQINKENVDWLWTNITKFDSLFSDYASKDYGSFIKRLCDPDTLLFKIGNNGYVFLESIIPEKECTFHGASFDRQLIGKEETALQIIRLAFEIFKLERMSARVPEYARFACGFLKRIGFQKEGVIRKTFKYKGDLKDLIIWGILKSEV